MLTNARAQRLFGDLNLPANSIQTDGLRQRKQLLVSLCLGAGIALAPTPAGLTDQAWYLFAIFAATIFAVISGGATNSGFVTGTGGVGAQWHLGARGCLQRL